MKFILIALGTIAPSLTAAQWGGWNHWSSETPPPSPPTPSSPPLPAIGWTEWLTSIQYVPTTIYNTVSVAGPVTTEKNTETVTIYNTVTQINTIAEISTVTQINTVTAIPAPETVLSIVSSVDTIAQTQTVANTITVTQTVHQTAVVSEAVTITSLTSVAETISVSYCTSQTLTGIVTCPSRIVNPTYTPPTPLPSNYLWGCPPGKLCHPKKENCNFEQNPPADTYVCAPEECLPVADLPPLETWLNYENVNDTCAWLTPIDDYFNLNPTFFGLDFGIFNIFGQPKCSSMSPASTVTIEVSAQPLVVPTTVTVPVTPTGWQSWQSAPLHPPPSPSSTGWAAEPQITKRAELAHRDLGKKAIVVASQCYAVCDYAAAVYQSMGKVPALCSADSPWSVAFGRVTSCTSVYSATGVTSVASILNDPILYCRSNPPSLKRGLFGRRAMG